MTIPSSVTSIGTRAFAGCEKLAKITLPNSVEKLGSGAFSGCTSLPVEGNIRYADTWAVEVTDKTLAKLLLSGKHVQGSIITDFLALQAPPLKGYSRLSGKNLFDKCE